MCGQEAGSYEVQVKGMKKKALAFFPTRSVGKICQMKELSTLFPWKRI